MVVIKYDEKTVLDAQNRIDMYNSEILEALEKIDIEFNNMEETLSTPKSKPAIAYFIDYYNNAVDYVRNSKDNYNNMFNNINNEYHEYNNIVKEMVGESNGNK